LDYANTPEVKRMLVNPTNKLPDTPSKIGSPSPVDIEFGMDPEI
jgi:hypothetical protein